MKLGGSSTRKKSPLGSDNTILCALVIAASGGNDLGVGDVDDDHFYPGPGGRLPNGDAGVLGEFGGLGLPLKVTLGKTTPIGATAVSPKLTISKSPISAWWSNLPANRSHLSAAVLHATDRRGDRSQRIDDLRS